jgi:hypothetical protein
MTSDLTFEQSTPCPQGSSTGWGEVPLLPQNIWQNPQIAAFSGPGHMSTHRMGVLSSSRPVFQFASSSLSSALSPSVSSSNPTPVHLQPDRTPQYLCGSPIIEPGSAPMDMDYDDINQDHHPADPDRGSISTVVDIPLNSVETHSPACFAVLQNSSIEHPSENVSIPNNAHSHANQPNLEVEVPSVASALSVSAPPVSSVHDMPAANYTPGTAIPETLVLEEAPDPLSSPRSEPVASTKSKRGKQGFNYKLSSSLPVTIE